MEKTYRASIIGLTKTKKVLLDADYENYQWWMIFGVDHGLLSCFKTHKRFKQKKITYREYPLPLWSVLIKDWLRERNTKIVTHWIKIPNSGRKGRGIWLPLKFHQKIPPRFIMKDSYLVKKKGKYYLHFCFDVPERMAYTPKTMLGIDLGLKNPVTLVDMNTRKTSFLGQDIKSVRSKYYYLRKRLGHLKKPKQIKKMRHKERNKITTILHNVSKTIVLQAYKARAAIIIGELKRFKKNKGRRMNRKLSSFPTYKLTSFIQYKAKEKGVPVILVNEAYTSRTCHACGMHGTRTKNWFACASCGYEDNADRNAAFNIGQRGLNYTLGPGVPLTPKSHSLAAKWQAQQQSL